REVIKYLGINENKICVVPLFPAEFTASNNADEAFSKHNIAHGEYFLYPAQFWAHKNHYHLVQAFAAFLNSHSNKQFKLVLTGSDKGNAPYIRNLVQQLGIGNNVVFAGFVEDDFLSALYKHAAALVMPTFLGPTNMPLLEAARVLCPVICTNFEGHREMLADGALYIDPLSSDSIAAAMQQVVTAEASNNLKQKLQQINATSAFTLKNTLNALNKGFVLAQEIRNCWD
ncbi:MAG TPA: glycosyltransferase family 1 protein, partial [Chitinophagales bacterium]|nr:glycosyltransferase family 1 protein [Chitinophagales bacterium]